MGRDSRHKAEKEVASEKAMAEIVSEISCYFHSGRQRRIKACIHMDGVIEEYDSHSRLDEHNQIPPYYASQHRPKCHSRSRPQILPATDTPGLVRRLDTQRSGPNLLVIILNLVIDNVEELELVDATRGGHDTEPITQLLLLEELLGPT